MSKSTNTIHIHMNICMSVHLLVCPKRFILVIYFPVPWAEIALLDALIVDDVQRGDQLRRQNHRP